MRNEKIRIENTPRFLLISNLYNLILNLKLNSIKNKIIKLNNHYISFKKQRNIQALGPKLELTKDELYQKLALNWRISSELIHTIVEKDSGIYFHFLQPNQYLPDSKIFSKGEVIQALSADSTFGIYVKKGYPILEKHGVILKNKGVQFFSLTSVFSRHNEQVYIDNCCHLNGMGEKKVIDEIISKIQAN